MSPEPLDAQAALAAYIRDPDHATAPAGIEARRLRIYADLFYNNVEGLLSTAFPAMRLTLGDTGWAALVRDFLREHDARSSIFSDTPRELLRYLGHRQAQGVADPPWLRELAHYEWVELALQISEARPEDVPHDPDGDLRLGVPTLSPLAWPLAYDWPVHRIGPGAQPEAPLPTLLLVYRTAAGDVAFHELGPLAFHLLQRLESGGATTGEALLRRLATDAQATDVERLVEDGLALLESYRRDGIVLGTCDA